MALFLFIAGELGRLFMDDDEAVDIDEDELELFFIFEIEF
jgi:hypothetical protein